MKKVLPVLICVLLICCGIVHRNVLKSLITGSEMPEAPEWHVWVPKEGRRSSNTEE